jgi:hypothetical protein
MSAAIFVHANLAVSQWTSPSPAWSSAARARKRVAPEIGTGD